MRLTTSILDLIAGRPVDGKGNATSLLMGLAQFPSGLSWPHRMAQFLAQVMHESASFTYDREIWNPAQVPAQARYDTRTDLGNTPAADGDGYRNRGMGSMQLTGADNRRRYRDWLKVNGFPQAPDFVETEALLQDPWEGLSAVWYWDAGNPTRESLNVFADDGNIMAITRKVNGGLFGFEDRCALYTRAALVLGDFGSSLDVLGERGSRAEHAAIRDAQRSMGFQGKDVDGISGTKTMAALHMVLKSLRPLELGDPAAAERAAAAKAALNAMGLVERSDFLKVYLGQPGITL